MRKKRMRVRRKNTTIIRPRRRHLEPSDLDEYELPELEDWMTGGGK